MNARGRYLRLPAERLQWRIAGPVIFAVSAALWLALAAAAWGLWP